MLKIIPGVERIRAFSAVNLSQPGSDHLDVDIDVIDKDFSQLAIVSPNSIAFKADLFFV